MLICCFVLLGSLIVTPLAAYSNQSHSQSIILAPTGSSFDYIVTILMENNGYCEVITTCGGGGPYQTSLAAAYGLAGTCQSDSACSIGGYSAIDHPSEGNYVQLISGDDYGFTGDCGYCPARTSAANIIDRIEASGRTWDAWFEGGSGSGTCSAHPPRGGDHYAFITFTDIQTNAARCSHLLSTTASTDTQFLAELNSATPANYIWLTPTDSNNCHDTAMSFCDNYLKTLVPKILSSTLFTTKRAALWIQYDEGNDSYPHDFVYGSWSGPVVKTGYVGTGSYDHYSYLKTLEVVWGLSSLTSNDANANPMTEFFGATTPPVLSTAFTFSPSTPIVNLPVTFSSTTTGGASPYTISWNFGDGTTGTGASLAHTFTGLQSYTVTETATDSSTPTQTATSAQTIPVVASLPLSTSFTFLPTNPTVSSPVSFTAVTTGGTLPYTISWNFGDSASATGATVTHTYATAQLFTVTETATDASSPKQIATATHTVVVSSSLTGNFDNTGGTDSPIGTTDTYDPGDSFGWDIVTLQANPGQTGILTADATQLCQGDLAAWGLPANTQCTLAGIEIGTEGYLLNSVNVDWYNVGLNIGLIPLSTSFTISPTNPLVNKPVTFTSTTVGGTSPYTISWNFGDGSTGAGTSTTHTYSTAQTFTVTETATDSSSPSKTTASSKTVTPSTPPPPSTSFTSSPTSPQVNSPVTFASMTTGGTAPYSITWTFGDGASATGTTITHTFTSAQSFTVTETATDSSSPSQTATSAKTVTVSPPPPPSTSFTFLPSTPLVNTPVAFTAVTTGGTSPYTVTWSFGDGTTGTGITVTHTFTTAQSFTVTETAADSSSPRQTATSSRFLTVSTTPPLSATITASTSSAQVGQTVSFTASATGGTTPYSYAISFGDGATGTGRTPTYAYSTAGSYTVTVTVTDSGSPRANSLASITVNVQALLPPALALPGNRTGVSGSWINFTVTARSPNPARTVTLSASQLPAGAIFDSSIGVFSWKPGASETGYYTITFTATDDSSPPMSSTSPMGIQVNQAAPGGSGGGGSGGGSNGGCFLCGTFPVICKTMWLLIVGGLLGLVTSLALLTIKARASLEHTKRRLNRMTRDD